MQGSKKLIALVLTVIMLIGLIAGCGGTEVSSSVSSSASSSASGTGIPEKPEELTFWLQQTFVDGFNQLRAQRLEEWGKNNGIKVSAEIIEAASLAQKLAAAVEAKDTPNACNGGQTTVLTYQTAGLLVDVSEMYAKIQADNGEFFPSYTDAATIDGKQYGFPEYNQSWLLWYRKDVLAAAGFTTPPTTWEELLTQAVAVTNPSENFYGAGFPAGAGSSDFNNMFQSLMWSYGGSLVKDGKLNVTSAETKEALNMLLEYFNQGAVAPDMLAGDDMANNTAMLTGAACFIVNIPTIANALKTNAPDIYKNTGAVPMPAGPDGSFPLASPSIMSVYAHSESEDYWTQQAIAYMLEPDYYNTLIGLVAPAYAGVYKDFVPADEYSVALVDALGSAKLYQYPNATLTTGHAAILTREFMVNNFVAYHLVDGLSFDDALTKWAGELQTEMDRVS